jgi:hypothetical protein
VRAKTGTLSGKSSLSGYVGDGHEVLIFSIFVDGIRNRRFTTMAVRNAQVSAVNAMMRFARGIVGGPTEEVEPGVDFEVGEEILEADLEEKASDALPEPAKAPDVSRAADPTRSFVEPKESRESREPRGPRAPLRPKPIEPEVEIPDDGDDLPPPVPRSIPSFSGNRRPGSAR